MNFNKFSIPRYDAILNFQRDHMFVSFFLRYESYAKKSAAKKRQKRTMHNIR